MEEGLVERRKWRQRVIKQKIRDRYGIWRVFFIVLDLHNYLEMKDHSEVGVDDSRCFIIRINQIL